MSATVGDKMYVIGGFLDSNLNATRRVDRFDAVAGLGDDSKVGLLVDDVGDAGAKQRMVVDQEHAGACRDGGVGLSLQRAPAWARTWAPTPAPLPFRSAAP